MCEKQPEAAEASRSEIAIVGIVSNHLCLSTTVVETGGVFLHFFYKKKRGKMVAILT